MRRAVLLVFGLLTWSETGTAQLPLSGPAPSVLFAYRPGGGVKSPVAAEPSDSLRGQPRLTYWKEGGVIAGALGAVGGALVGHHLCGLAEESTKHCTGSLVLGGVLGAALLAIPGALIGGQFAKEPSEADRPE